MVDLGDDVALHQTGLLGGTATHDTRKEQSLRFRRVIRNRARRHAHARQRGAGLRRIDFRELRRHVRVGDRLDHRGGEVDDAIEIFVVDFVCRVGWTVIVRVRTGGEEQRRQPRLVEVRAVGRLIRIGIGGEIEPGGDVRALENPRPYRARRDAVRRQLVVLHAADHVEVHIRRDLIEGHRRAHHERVRADQSNLLARPEGEHDVAAHRLAGELRGDREHRRGA